MPDLCLGGGVALNGVANARILAESGFERVFVPSAPGDAGCALGAALYADRIYFGNPDRDVPDHPFWGPAVDAAGAGAGGARGRPGRRRARRRRRCIERIADELAAGRIVGWMDGASRVRPARARPSQHPGRAALGARCATGSIATSSTARSSGRSRRSRPIEAADRYFELPPGGARLARFMSGVFPVRPEWRTRLAAVTHVDGSARLQALERDMAPRLYALLEAYGRRTGIPVLLNTSFNVAGEPIVNRALEGLFDVPALRDRRARRRADAGDEARVAPASALEGGGRMIKKRGGMRRRLIMLGSAGGSIADLVRGLWRSDSGKRWLVPLAVFLCLFGLVLILATTVEALAPFIYAIF